MSIQGRLNPQSVFVDDLGRLTKYGVDILIRIVNQSNSTLSSVDGMIDGTATAILSGNILTFTRGDGSTYDVDLNGLLVSTAMLANQAVTSDKIQNGAVTQPKLGSDITGATGAGFIGADDAGLNNLSGSTVQEVLESVDVALDNTAVQWQSASGTFTAEPDTKLAIDTSSGPSTITLPTTPEEGSSVEIVDISFNASVNNINIITPLDTITVNIDGLSIECIYLSGNWEFRAW